MIGVHINGISIIVFNTMGRPKVMGSLIPQRPEGRASLPRALYLWLLARKHIITHKPAVPPAPPREAKPLHADFTIILGSGQVFHGQRHVQHVDKRHNDHSAVKTEEPHNAAHHNQHDHSKGAGTQCREWSLKESVNTGIDISIRSQGEDKAHQRKEQQDTERRQDSLEGGSNLRRNTVRHADYDFFVNKEFVQYRNKKPEDHGCEETSSS